MRVGPSFVALVCGVFGAGLGCSGATDSDTSIPGAGGAASATVTTTGMGGASATTTGAGGASSGAGGSSTGAGGATAGGLHASGNKLLSADGQQVQIRGVNRSGTEYACVEGWGMFDGPSDDASLDAITAWKANAVRVPLNEDCWLAINGVSAQYSGDVYKQAITDWVGRIEQHGLIPILELHWSAPGTTLATQQVAMPDADHSPAFWADVAKTFKTHPNVIFEPFNEPFPDSNNDTTAAWSCWRDGGTCPGVTSDGVAYQAAGMQALVDAIRGAGATNFVLLGGVQYSNALSHWLEYAPKDPLNNIGAAWHVYNFNICSGPTCYDIDGAPVAAAVPLVATEIGEDDCAGAFIDEIMGWLDGHTASYLGWTWNTWNKCLVLITDFSGTPNGAYGQAYKSHLALAP